MLSRDSELFHSKYGGVEHGGLSISAHSCRPAFSETALHYWQIRRDLASARRECGRKSDLYWNSECVPT